MRTRVREFFLFTFAFSSILSAAEVVPSKFPNDKTFIESTSQNSNLEQPRVTKNVQFELGATDHGMEKRSAEEFDSQNRDKESFNTADETNFDKFEKRNRMGFTGMRGKKEFSPDDYCAKVRSNPESSLNFNKRLSRSYSDFFGGKRAPFAFHGMRGKKSEGPEMDSDNFLIDSGLIDPSELEDDFIAFNKRAPYSFLGMRGKKGNLYDQKRATGFLGMRGKKETGLWDPNPNYKRAPQSSFFGMKGKKAQSGFFGMRGKKASPSDFFEVKGKQDPLDYDFHDFSSPFNQMKESEASNNRYRRGVPWFTYPKKTRNAFFGSRGKKSTEERPDRIHNSLE